MRPEIESILAEVEKVIVGKHEVVEEIMMAILAEGHILLDDVPGVGKTTLASTLSKVLGIAYGRVQFTPDVLPSDIVGFSMFDKASGSFKYMPGIVTQVNLLLCDEINRTSSKTQSALLEAMEEKQVTVDGTVHPLKDPFVVIATQNSVGTVGTQLLPQAQLDRFLVKLTIGYPDKASEMEIIRDREKGNPALHTKQVSSCEDVLRMQREVLGVEMADAIVAYIAELSEASRRSELLDLGISPRGSIVLSRMARAKAYIEGRSYVVPEDVASVFADVCAHRILLGAKAKDAHVTQREVLAGILEEVKVPDTRG